MWLCLSSVCLWRPVFGIHTYNNDNYGDFNEILVDSGSEATACNWDFGEEFGTTAALVKHDLRSVDGTKVPLWGERNVNFEIKDATGKIVQAPMKFQVAGVTKPIVSVGDLTTKGYEVQFQGQGGRIAKGSQTVPLVRRGNHFMLQVKRQRATSKHVAVPCPV